MTLKDLSAYFLLNGGETELTGRVMANDELNQRAAKIADTIEEHETVRNLRHVVSGGSCVRPAMTLSR